MFFLTDIFTITGARLISLSCNIYFSMYLIRGKEKHSGEKITILLLCQENSFSYLRDLLFSEEPEIKKIDKLDIWNIKNKIKKFSTNMDAIFINAINFILIIYRKVDI